MSEASLTPDTVPEAPTVHSIHEGCFVCGQKNPLGLRAVFVSEGDGSVLARVRCEPLWAGYPGSLHGGITTSLLDGAMVHCLFARGIAAVTARMSVDFHGPVLLSEELTVTAMILSGKSGIYKLEGELCQAGRVRVTARGTFVQMRGCELDPSQWKPVWDCD